MENCHENIPIGNFILDNGIGNYIVRLIDNAHQRFKLNDTNLLVKFGFIDLFFYHLIHYIIF